jgi:hypothetical protein
MQQKVLGLILLFCLRLGVSLDNNEGGVSCQYLVIVIASHEHEMDVKLIITRKIPLKD